MGRKSEIRPMKIPPAVFNDNAITRRKPLESRVKRECVRARATGLRPLNMGLNKSTHKYRRSNTGRAGNQLVADNEVVILRNIYVTLSRAPRRFSPL